MNVTGQILTFKKQLNSVEIAAQGRMIWEYMLKYNL